MFHKIWGISCLAEGLLACQEGLCCMVVVINLTEVICRIKQGVKLLINMFVGNSSHELHLCSCSVILYHNWVEGDVNSNFEDSSV
jgi:hypothetical protein